MRKHLERPPEPQVFRPGSRQWMLRNYCGYGYLRARSIHAAVSVSDSWFGTPSMGDKEFPNIKRIKVRHYANIPA